jgi:hypothetical protein
MEWREREGDMERARLVSRMLLLLEESPRYVEELLDEEEGRIVMDAVSDVDEHCCCCCDCFVGDD